MLGSEYVVSTLALVPTSRHRHALQPQFEPNPAIEQFRGKSPGRKTHPAELVLLWIVSLHLVFLPWALGGMREWSQWISFGFSVLGFVVALVPRDYTTEHTGAGEFRLIIWPKLLRFPIFWLGLLLLALIVIQALNPAWVYVTDGKGWWMQKLANKSWLPSGVDVPFANWGPWRQLLIYSSVWLTVCAIWVGFTRRRTLQRLLIAVAFNGVALAVLGMMQRFIPSKLMFWYWQPPPNAAFYSSFIYKNHAGAYLLLALGITLGLALWYYVRGVRRLEKSNPAGVFAFAGLVIAISMLVSYARGATLTMLVFLALLILGFLIHEFFFSFDRRRPVVVSVLLVVFGVFLSIGYRALDVDKTWMRISRGLADGGDYSYRSRKIADQASLDMLKEHWQLGAGAGTFRFLFPAYQQKYPEIVTFPGTIRRQFWQHAHNDILEFPIELGLPGILLITIGTGYWLLALLRRYIWDKPLSLVTVLAAAAVTAYSWWDFPFQCPAIFMLWSVLWPTATRWAVLEESRGRT